MKAVILAAGEGARMGPFTASIPKVMIPVGNRPILEYVVSALVENGLTDLMMVVGYRRERIQAHFEDGKKFGARITFLHEAKQLGTAHALGEARSHLGEAFYVFNGSNLIDAAFVAELRERSEGAAVAVTESERPEEYGVVTEDDGRLVDIVERPRIVSSNLINTGAYRLDASIFPEIERLGGEGIHDLPAVLSTWARDQEVSTVRAKGMWLDARYPWDLLTLNEAALLQTSDLRAGTLEPAVTIRGRVAIGSGCVIRSGAYLQGPLSLGAGCEIGPNAVLLPSTSLGKNVRIGPNTSVANSILMDDVILGPSSVVQDSVIGSGVLARAGLLAAAGTATVEIEGEFHPVPRIGALLGEDTKLGSGVSVACGTLVHERARVESGSRLRGTIPAGAVVL